MPENGGKKHITIFYIYKCVPMCKAFISNVGESRVIPARKELQRTQRETKRAKNENRTKTKTPQKERNRCLNISGWEVNLIKAVVE